MLISQDQQANKCLKATCSKTNALQEQLTSSNLSAFQGLQDKQGFTFCSFLFLSYLMKKSFFLPNISETRFFLSFKFLNIPPEKNK